MDFFILTKQEGCHKLKTSLNLKWAVDPKSGIGTTWKQARHFGAGPPVLAQLGRCHIADQPRSKPGCAHAPGTWPNCNVRAGLGRPGPECTGTTGQLSRPAAAPTPLPASPCCRACAAHITCPAPIEVAFAMSSVFTLFIKHA